MCFYAYLRRHAKQELKGKRDVFSAVWRKLNRPMETPGIDTLFSNSLPEAIQSSELTLVHLKFSFGIGFLVYLLLIPFCRSKKTFFGAIAAKKTISAARFFIFAELLLLFILYYFYFQIGVPIKLHQYLSYGNGDGWLYSYGRPTAGLVFIGVGMLGEQHPVIRFLCMFGCCGEMLGDSLSAFQIGDYKSQIKHQDAPSHGYTQDDLTAYYWRDIISFGVCTTVLLLIGHLMMIVGCFEPQIIHPSLISGNELDRFYTMRLQKERRKAISEMGMLGESQSSFHNTNAV